MVEDITTWGNVESPFPTGGARNMRIGTTEECAKESSEVQRISLDNVCPVIYISLYEERGKQWQS